MYIRDPQTHTVGYAGPAQGYGGIMLWDLSGDYKDELGGTAGKTFRGGESRG